MQQFIGIMVVIVLVCFLSFCEDPMAEQKEPEIIIEEISSPPIQKNDWKSWGE